MLWLGRLRKKTICFTWEFSARLIKVMMTLSVKMLLKLMIRLTVILVIAARMVK